MSDEKQGTLGRIYDDLKQLHDEIALKVHLGGIEVRDQWNELDAEWSTWMHQVAKELHARGEEVEQRLREAGGDDLRKIEIKTELAISKLKRGLKEVADKLKDD